MKRERKQWENEEILQIGRREAHTDFKRHDNFSEKLSLNGEWKFLFLKAPEYSPEHFEEKNYADESWDEIKVPGCWGTEWIRKTSLYRCMVSVSNQSTVCTIRKSDSYLQKKL